MSVRVIEDNDHFVSELSKATGQTLVVTAFTATWCGACRNIKPYFVQLPKKYPQVTFLEVDVDKSKQATQSQRVTSMPTFVFYRNEKEIDRMIGANTDGLEAKIKQYIGPNDRRVSTFSEQGSSCSTAPGSPKTIAPRTITPKTITPRTTPPRSTPLRTTPPRTTTPTTTPVRPRPLRPTPRKLIFDDIGASKTIAHKSAARISTVMKATVPKTITPQADTKLKFPNETINSTQRFKSFQIIRRGNKTMITIE